METNCLNGAIGISNIDCDCQEPLNETLKQSKSGYFLHDLSGVVDLSTVVDIVQCQDLNSFYTRLLEGATREAKDDLSAQISERYKRTDLDFSGILGSRSHSKVLDVKSKYIALKITPRKGTDSTLFIKSVGIAFDKTVDSFDAVIYRVYDDTEMIEEIDVIEGLKSIANTFNDNIIEESISLPLSIQGEGHFDYYIVIDRSVHEFKPRNNGASCGCGGKERKLLSSVGFSGVNGEEIENIDNWSAQSVNVNGIVLNAEIKCDSEMFICKMNDESGWRQYMAQAILYKAAAKLHREVLSSKKLTQAVLMDRETVANNMNLFEADYWERIRFLVQNMDLSKTSCFGCNNKNMAMKNILV